MRFVTMIALAASCAWVPPPGDVTSVSVVEGEDVALYQGIYGTRFQNGFLELRISLSSDDTQDLCQRVVEYRQAFDAAYYLEEVVTAWNTYHPTPLWELDLLLILANEGALTTAPIPGAPWNLAAGPGQYVGFLYNYEFPSDVAIWDDLLNNQIGRPDWERLYYTNLGDLTVDAYTPATLIEGVASSGVTTIGGRDAGGVDVKFRATHCPGYEQQFQAELIPPEPPPEEDPKDDEDPKDPKKKGG